MLLFISFIHLLEEQFLFSLLEHWARADHSGCLDCAGAGGVVMLLSLQLQWPHSNWLDMWTPELSTEYQRIL